MLVAVNNAFSELLLEWTGSDPLIEIVGTAYSSSHALEVIDSLRVELVLADTTLPDINGFELTRRLKRRRGAPLVVLLSFYGTLAAEEAARLAGADGFLSKSEIADRLMPLVEGLIRRRRSTSREPIPGLETTRVVPETPPADTALQRGNHEQE